MENQYEATEIQVAEVLESTPPEDWMLQQQHDAKRAGGKMASSCNDDVLVSKRPKTAEEETKPGRKTKVVRVKQEYIDLLLSRGPPRPFVGLSDELIDKVPSAALRAEMRVLYRQVADRMRSGRAKDADILEQYRTKGYAEEEVEIPEEDNV